MTAHPVRQAFRYVTLPLMMPLITVVATIRAIDAFRAFDVIYTLTQGGPADATPVFASSNLSDRISERELWFGCRGGDAAFCGCDDLEQWADLRVRPQELRAESMQSTRRFRLLITYLVAFLLAVALVLPPAWLFLTSLKPVSLTFALPPVWIFTPTLEHYISVLERPNFIRVLSNTLIVSTVSTAITIVFGSLAAYSIARFHTGGVGFLYATLVARVLPPVILGLPFFVLFYRLGLIDTLQGLIITYGTFALPLVIWIMIPFFDEIPRELEEAAIVDGCSRLGAMWRVTFPLARSGFIVTTLLTFMGAWNQFFFALILASEKAKTLPLEASAFISDYAVEWGPVAAMGSILIIPPILVVIILQKRLVRGLTLGGVKG